MFDANTRGEPLPRLMNAIRTPSLVVAYWIGGEIIDVLTRDAVRPHASAGSFQRETWAAFVPQALRNPTLVVLENQEHTAVGRRA
jgi:hypothetical protein